MNISVPSRFACLKIEDDDPKKSTPSNTNNQKPKCVIKKNGTPAARKTSTAIHNNVSKNPKVSQRTKQKHQRESAKQWEDWKKKDSELVDDNYEQDLQSAIVQSKIEYEANRKRIGNSGKAMMHDDNNKKKKSKTTMNLSEFLGKKATAVAHAESKGGGDEEFFNKMLLAAELEVAKSQIEEGRKERDLDFEKSSTIAQYQERLMTEQAKSHELQCQLALSKAEVVAVKARNKTLCSILAQGEMRDKAEVLLELERLNIVKDELTEEVAHLHELLEQERSKIATFPVDNGQNNKPKDKNKRKKSGA